MAIFTPDGQSWVANELASSEPIEQFVLANVDPQNLPAGVPAGEVFDLSEKGYLNPNTVVYSLILGTDIGDFTYNYIGLIANNKIVAYVTVPEQEKRKTDGVTQGNNLSRNFALTFDNAVDITGIDVPVSSWQVDFSGWFSAVDERERLSNQDLYGRQFFLMDAFKVYRYSSDLKTKAGVGYVAGLRVEQNAASSLNSNAQDGFVYIDVSLRKGLYKAEVNVDYIISNQAESDYVDNTGTQHYVERIASIDGGVITDERTWYNIESPILLSQLFRNRPMLDGPASVLENSANTYQITNFSFDVNYSVSSSAGSASINHDQITFNAGDYQDGSTQRLFVTANELVHEYEIQVEGLDPANPPASINYPGTSSSGDFNVTWDSVANADSYTLQQQKNGGSWVTKASGGASTSYAADLSDGTYRFRVRAENSDGESSWVTGSNCVVDIPNPPAVPSAIGYPPDSTSGNFTVNWSSVANATGYTLEQQKNGGSWTTVVSDQNVTSYNANVSPGDFKYRVKSINGDGESNYRTGHVITIYQSMSVSKSDGGSVILSEGSSPSGTTFKKSTNTLTVTGGSGDFSITIENAPASEWGGLYDTSSPGSATDAVGSISYTETDGTSDGSGGLVFSAWVGGWTPVGDYGLSQGEQETKSSVKSYTVTDNVSGQTVSGNINNTIIIQGVDDGPIE
jgi:hypothetical protein